jgi:hypothetical protein
MESSHPQETSPLLPFCKHRAARRGALCRSASGQERRVSTLSWAAWVTALASRALERSVSSLAALTAEELVTVRSDAYRQCGLLTMAA